MKDLELGFCDKNITLFGGMVLMKKMMDHLGFSALLKSLPLPQPCSNRGYDPTQLMTQFMISQFGVEPTPTSSAKWCASMMFYDESLALKKWQDTE